MEVRVVLEKIRILDDREFRGEEEEAPPRGPHTGEGIDLDVHVQTGDNGTEQHTRLPREGFYHLVSGWSINVDETIFEGDVSDHLEIRIDAVRPGSTDPPDTLASYTRELSADPETLFGRYEPDQTSGPEHLGFWQVYYRVEPR